MNNGKKIGVYLDHVTARLIELNGDAPVTRLIESEFTPDEREFTKAKSENVMHNKEHHQQEQYYHKIGECVKGFDEVLLFGPTTAKNELHNVLLGDKAYAGMKIHLEDSDKMTEKNQDHFVADFFAKNI
jgi:hypothetical protein